MRIELAFSCKIFGANKNEAMYETAGKLSAFPHNLILSEMMMHYGEG